MSSAAIAGVIFVSMIVLIMLGVPIALTMLPAALIGFTLIGSPQMVVSQFSTGLLSVTADYSFAVLPLFMMVGVLAGETGIASGIYSSAKKWLGGVRGGLLYTTVGANALFGTVSGSSAAGIVVFGRIAYPELLKEGYDRSTAAACISASGALSCLIPPSVPILTLCLIAEASIGTALLTGMAAGLLMTLVTFIVIKVTGIVSPAKIPPVREEDRHVSWRERLESLKLLGPVIILFMLIVGGTYLGWFHATVGGAIATCAVVVYALFKRMPIKKIFQCMWDGCQTFSLIFIIISGGLLFSRFVTLTGLTTAASKWIAASGLGKYAVFGIIAIFYLIAGCLMDVFSLIIVTTPIVYPLLTSVGLDGFVVIVALVFLSELGQLTPPVGFGVFQAAAVMKESPALIFKGVLPFFIAMFITLVLFILFPVLVLWAPMLLG